MARKITSIKTLLVASQSYLNEHGTPQVPSDLLHGHNKLHYRNTSGVFHFIDEQDRKVQINLPSTIISNNGDYLSQCALEGLGIISTPDLSAIKKYNQGN